MKANFLTLQGTIGASLVNLFKPILVIVNNAIVLINQFAKAIGDSLGKILGWKYEIGEGGAAIEDTADYVDDIGDAAGGAGKAVKDLKKQLQGFDELNNLTSDDDNGGGGRGSGYSGLGAGGSFARAGQWVETEKLYDSEWDTWFKLGRGIGDAWADGLKSINWDYVYAGATGFGTGLADFLNGLITPNLFGTLGTTIANSLNTVVYGAMAFGDTLDWSQMGDSIAAGVNGFMENYDFSATAKTINKFATGILDMLITAVNNIKWDEFGTALTDFITGVDLPEIASKASSLAGKVIDGLSTAIGSVSWSTVGEEIGAMIAALDIPDLVSKLATLAWKIISALADAFVGLASKDPLSAGIIALLGAAKLANLAETLSSRIVGALGGSTGEFSLNGAGLKVKLIGATVLLAGVTAMLSDDTSLAGAFMSTASVGIGTLMITGNPYIAITAATIAGMINLLKIDNATVEQYIMDQEEQGMYNDAAASKLAETGTLDFSDWEKYSNYTNDMVLDMDRAVEELRAAGYTEKDIAYELSKYSGLSEYIANTQAIANSRKAPDWLKKVVTQVNNPKPSTTSSKKDNSTNPMGMGGSILSLNSGSLINDLSNVNEMIRSVGETTKNVSSQVSTETATMSTNANTNFASLAKSASTNASLTSTSWAGNLSAMASKTTADTSSMTSTITKWGSDITKIVSNTKPKATLGVDMTSESTVSTQYNKLSGIWKSKTSAFKVDPTATAQSTVTSAWNDRAGKWSNKIAGFSVDATKTPTKDVTSAWDERSGKWQSKAANFSVDTGKTLVSDVSSAWSERAGKWINKTANYAIASVTTPQNIQSAWNPLSNEWKDKTSSYAVKSETSTGTIHSVWSQLSNEWKDKTSGYYVQSGTSSSTIKNTWDGIAYWWQDKTATFSLNFSTSLGEVGEKITGAVSKGSVNTWIASLENRMKEVGILAKDKTLPRLATGGVVDRATLAMIGEAGAEAVVPLEKNTQWLGKMADMLAQEMAYKEYTPPAYGSATYNGSTSYSGSATASSRAREEAIAEQNMLLREEIALLRQIAEKDLTIGDSDIFNATRRGYRSYVDRTGDSPFM